MASGIPVVSSRCGALADTVGDAAYPVDPENAHQIADAMATMLAGERVRQDYIGRGWSHVKQFGGEQAARHYESLYAELAA